MGSNPLNSPESPGVTGKTLLVVLAHPDDESFGNGGTLAYYAALGVNVVLICATNGDVGEISDESLATAETLPQVRINELRCACQHLGITDLRLLQYRDSGMLGTPANEHPQSLYQADLNEVTEKVVRIIREVKPQVVVTFEETGGYGHPDHVTMHRATVAAFTAAGDLAQYSTAGPPYRPQKLYYTAMPKSLFRNWAVSMTEQGVDVTRFGANQDMNMESMGVPDELITTYIRLAPAAVEARLAATQCHQTQIPPNSPFRVLSREQLRQNMEVEYYILAQGDLSCHPETDLFAGVRA
jgi:N-acetyl-1-D-myo-inositol-2-amino-2-deoxy-alpha-D-glucopyranoside deacetylase